MKRQFVPLARASEHGIPQGQKALAWVANFRDYNGAEKAGAIVKFGGRLYVDPDKFLDWMATGPRISPPGIRWRVKTAVPE
jgi:hypothetical protein